MMPISSEAQDAQSKRDAIWAKKRAMRANPQPAQMAPPMV